MRYLPLYLIFILMLGCGDTTTINYINSFNQDNDVSDIGGGCLTCLEAATELKRIVSDDELCEAGLEDFDNLKDCSAFVPSCKNFANESAPMNETCFNALFHTTCESKIFLCASE